MMSELEALAVLMNLANLADLWTTKVGLSLGLREANPFAEAILKTYGFQGMATYKIAFPFLASTACLTAETPKEKLASALLMATLGIVYAFCSLNNVLVIALKLAKR
jgi:hypothetical protein